MEEQCELKISIHTKSLESSGCPRFNKATLNLCATKRYGRGVKQAFEIKFPEWKDLFLLWKLSITTVFKWKKNYLFSSGCRSTSNGEPLSTDCNACLYFKQVDTGECVQTCPEGFKEKDATCVPSELIYICSKYARTC